jgi:hypothetical protein
MLEAFIDVAAPSKGIRPGDIVLEDIPAQRISPAS